MMALRVLTLAAQGDGRAVAAAIQLAEQVLEDAIRCSTSDAEEATEAK